MSCTLSCPDGIKFDSPPAAAYTCKFDTGKFTPAKIPKCVYGEMEIPFTTRFFEV